MPLRLNLIHHAVDEHLRDLETGPLHDSTGRRAFLKLIFPGCAAPVSVSIKLSIHSIVRRTSGWTAKSYSPRTIPKQSRLLSLLKARLKRRANKESCSLDGRSSV